MSDTLGNILQVVRPIRMSFVASLSVPLDNPVGSLATALMPLSEPLRAIPPGGVDFPFGFFSEEFGEAHRFIPFTIREEEAVTYSPISSQPRKRLTPVFSRACVAEGTERVPLSIKEGLNRRASHQTLWGGPSQEDLMTPGISIAVKYSEEHLRQVRNPIGLFVRRTDIAHRASSSLKKTPVIYSRSKRQKINSWNSLIPTIESKPTMVRPASQTEVWIDEQSRRFYV